jgi:hypothetical protein
VTWYLEGDEDYGKKSRQGRGLGVGVGEAAVCSIKYRGDRRRGQGISSLSSWLREPWEEKRVRDPWGEKRDREPWGQLGEEHFKQRAHSEDPKARGARNKSSE